MHVILAVALGHRRQPPPCRPPASRCRPEPGASAGVEAPAILPGAAVARGRSYGAGFLPAQSRRRGGSRVRRRCRSGWGAGLKAREKILANQPIRCKNTTGNCGPGAKNICGTRKAVPPSIPRTFHGYTAWEWVAAPAERQAECNSAGAAEMAENSHQNKWLDKRPQPAIAHPRKEHLRNRRDRRSRLFREFFMGTRHAGSPPTGGVIQAWDQLAASGSRLGGRTRKYNLSSAAVD
jgi:hypothetical protein